MISNHLHSDLNLTNQLSKIHFNIIFMPLLHCEPVIQIFENYYSFQEPKHDK